MATFDLIGVPFPSNHPAFLSDAKMQKRIRQLENYIELHSDLDDVFKYLEQIINLVSIFRSGDKKNADIFNLGLDPAILIDGLSCAAVIQYAKCFVDSQGRMKLNAIDIFRQQNHKDSHKFFMNLRNQFFAHHQLEANRQQVFVFQATEFKPITINPFTQYRRDIITMSVDWKQLQECVVIVTEYLNSKTSDLKKTIENNLTPKQQNIINNSSKEELREYVRENRNPFSIR